MSVNICQQCQNKFTCKRRDKRHCGSSCQWLSQRSPLKKAPMPTEATCALGQSLKQHAPTGTVGYRLGMKSPTGIIWFPSLTGRSLRWDRSFSATPYFILNDKHFEPPRVPKPGIYVLLFVNAGGELLPTPEKFHFGVEVAEGSRMSWPGTHQVRSLSEHGVRTIVELDSASSSAVVKLRNSLS